MDIRRSINTKMWMDGWFETLKPDEKLLWLYLLTCPATNMLGIYEISIRRMSVDTRITEARILTIMKGFERVSKGYYMIKWVFLPNWIKNQSMNTNMMKSAVSLFNQLPNELKIKLKAKGFKDFESLSKGSLTLPKIEIEIEKEIEVEIEKGKGKRKDISDNGNSLHNSMIKIYSEWYNDKVGVKYPFQGGQDGSAIKAIIVNLRSAISEKNKKEATDDDVLNGWKFLLDSYDKWESFYQAQLKLSQISSNLANIYINIKGIRKDGKYNKTQAGKLTDKDWETLAKARRGE